LIVFSRLQRVAGAAPRPINMSNIVKYEQEFGFCVAVDAAVNLSKNRVCAVTDLAYLINLRIILFCKETCSYENDKSLFIAGVAHLFTATQASHVLVSLNPPAKFYRDRFDLPTCRITKQ
jgi:hypothetical protein